MYPFRTKKKNHRKMRSTLVLQLAQLFTFLFSHSVCVCALCATITCDSCSKFHRHIQMVIIILNGFLIRIISRNCEIINHRSIDSQFHFHKCAIFIDATHKHARTHNRNTFYVFAHFGQRDCIERRHKAKRF